MSVTSAPTPPSTPETGAAWTEQANVEVICRGHCRQITSVHGIWDATKEGQARFLRSAVDRIRSRCCQGHEECYRNLARSKGLRIALERALLTYDILESGPIVRKLFTQNLVFLGLNRQRNHESDETLQLLAKDQADLLQPFQKCREDPLRALSEGKTQIKTLHEPEFQLISLVRCLFEFSGGTVDCHQHAYDQQYTLNDNLNLYMTFIGVTGTNQFGDFDPMEMYDALSKSKVFDIDTNIGPLDLNRWSLDMMQFLPIGFPDLNLPSQVRSESGAGELDIFRFYLKYTYHQCPSLRKLENDTLLLLTWSSSITGRLLQVLTEWASSGNSLNLYQRLVKDFQESQKPEQLALTIAALLCRERLLGYTSRDTTQPINGFYLAGGMQLGCSVGIINLWLGAGHGTSLC